MANNEHEDDEENEGGFVDELAAQSHGQGNRNRGHQGQDNRRPEDKKGPAWNMFFNLIKIEVNRFARWLVERGYNIPVVQGFLHTLDGTLGSLTGPGFDVMAAVINNPQVLKDWVKKTFGAAAGEKINEIIDEFIDELIEKLRDLWYAHGQNVPPAELEKLSKARAAQPIVPFSDALIQLEEVKRRRLKSLLAALDATGDPSERTRFAFYRPRLNSPKALLALLDAADYAPDLLIQRLDTDPRYAGIRLDPGRFTALKERMLRDIQTGAKQRMFLDLETVYGEYKPPIVKRAGAFIAEKAKVVYGNPAVEIPLLTQKLETKTREMSNLRAQIRARRMARR